MTVKDDEGKKWYFLRRLGEDGYIFSKVNFDKKERKNTELISGYLNDVKYLDREAVINKFYGYKDIPDKRTGEQSSTEE